MFQETKFNIDVNVLINTTFTSFYLLSEDHYYQISKKISNVLQMSNIITLRVSTVSSSNTAVQ